MYIQHCVKGIAGSANGETGITKAQAIDLIDQQRGILSNWWRKLGEISPELVARELTDANLDRHLNDYARFGKDSPFISLACGAVERDVVVQHNWVYSAVNTALAFATGNWTRSGALFYLWVVTTQQPAVAIDSVAEPVRDLNVYRRWSASQPEGEVTAKVHIPANQIERVEWWDPGVSQTQPTDVIWNRRYVKPDPLSNIRDLF